MPEAVHVGSGKVRELFALDDERLLLVASDRISTFDVVLPTEIPDKGKVITGLSAFWFERTGELVVGDEVLTPDSSRYWPAEGYEPGRSQPSFDKQYVRDWASDSGWDKTPPAPALPDKVVDGTRRRYEEAYERITGEPFGQWMKRARGA